MQRVDGDDAPGEVESVRQLVQRRDLVGLGAHLELSQHQAAAVFHGRHQHAPPTLGLLRCATDILAVHADRRHAPPPPAALATPARLLRACICQILRDLPGLLVLLPGPLRHRAFQRLRRQGGEDVVERRDRRGGVALPAGAVETAHGQPLRLAQQAGELCAGRHTAAFGGGRVPAKRPPERGRGRDSDSDPAQKHLALRAPRQTGKTSALHERANRLNSVGEWRCVYANFEAG